MLTPLLMAQLSGHMALAQSRATVERCREIIDRVGDTEEGIRAFAEILEAERKITEILKQQAELQK